LSYDAHEFPIEAVSRIFGIARTYLAEPLARRTAIDEVNATGCEILLAGNAWLFVPEKPPDVAREQRYFREVG
jgi:hypothetical protein